MKGKYGPNRYGPNRYVPIRYVPNNLTKKDKKNQVKMILKSKKLYKKHKY